MKKTYISIIAVCVVFLLSLLLDLFVLENISYLQNPVFDQVFSYITNSINIFVILIGFTTLFLIDEKKKEWIPPLWISCFFAIGVSYALKFIVARPRPVGDLFSQTFPALNFSFPSMHAMVAFAALPIIIREFPRLKWFFIAFATLVAFSRLYFEVHYLSDVVFGAVVGYLIGYVVILIEKRYKPFAFLQ